MLLPRDWAALAAVSRVVSLLPGAACLEGVHAELEVGAAVVLALMTLCLF